MPPKKRLLGLVLILLLTCTNTGCSPFEVELKKIDELIRVVDRVIGTAEGMKGDLIHQSDAWRAKIGELEADFVKQGQQALAHDIRHATDHLLAGVDQTGIVLIDYLELKIRKLLLAVKSALEEARSEMQEAKRAKDRSRIPLILQKIAQAPTHLDPVINRAIPYCLRMDEVDGKITALTNDETPQFRGWGFSRPEGEAPRFAVFVEDNKGSRRRLPDRIISKTSNYQLQLDLTDVLATFNRSDRKLILATGKAPADEFTVPIVWQQHVPKKMLLTSVRVVVESASKKEPVGAIVVRVRHVRSNAWLLGGTRGEVRLGENEAWAAGQLREVIEPLGSTLELAAGDAIEVSFRTAKHFYEFGPGKINFPPAQWTGRVRAVFLTINGVERLIGGVAENKIWLNDSPQGWWNEPTRFWNQTFQIPAD